MKIEKIRISENAELSAYLHTPSREMEHPETVCRPAMIVCPGGGYSWRSDREAEPPAVAFFNMGMQVFVLRYSVGENAGNKQPLTELAASVKLVREHSAQWQIDTQKLAVSGFSAGAHLAASLGVHWDDAELAERCGVENAGELRPDAMVLCYPVISAGIYAHKDSIDRVSANCKENRDYWSLEKHVTAQTPPTFLWHTMDDELVPVENSFLFAQELHRAGIPCECHFFESGNHGMSVATKETGSASAHIHSWVELCRQWLTGRFGSLSGDTY